MTAIQNTTTSSSTPAPTPTPTPAEVSPAQVKQWLSAGEAVLIDVREPDEHLREHIEVATLLPLSSFDASKAAALAKPGQRIVVHCRSGRRSLDACRMAASLPSPTPPFTSMAGGIEAWKAAQLPIKANTSIARMSIMRQVQLVIGSGVLIGAALTYFLHPAFLILPAFFGAGLIFAGASGTCGLAAMLGMMPWNTMQPSCASAAGSSCSA